MEEARQLIARLAATPDAAVPRLPFLHRALTLPLLSTASVALRMSRILSSSRLRRRRALPVPVVSVGNITWGGNGKTPMVEYLARAFHRLGVSPLLLTRGYAGGDESRMLRRRLSDTWAKIGVGSNRAAVAFSMLQKYGCIHHSYTFCTHSNLEPGKIGVAILDDGMQHWSLLRDVEIVMVNGLAPWGNTHFIPRGPMREPLSALVRADIVVIHNADLVSEEQLRAIKCTIEHNSAKCSVFYSRLAPSHIFEANQPLRRLSLNVLSDKMVLCVSAIGCPDAFIHTVREIGALKIDRLDFSDHHFFNGHDLEIIQETVRNLVNHHGKDTIVLVTEKDYDRDPEALRSLAVKVWVLSSSLQIMPLKEDGEDELMRKVKEIIAATRHKKVTCVVDSSIRGADSANSSDLCQPSHDSEFVPTKSFEGVKSFFRWIWDSVINLFNDRWCRTTCSSFFNFSCHSRYIWIVVSVGLILAALLGAMLLWFLHQKGFFDNLYDWWTDLLELETGDHGVPTRGHRTLTTTTNTMTSTRTGKAVVALEPRWSEPVVAHHCTAGTVTSSHPHGEHPRPRHHHRIPL